MQYAPSFVGFKSILTDADKQWLARLGRVYPLSRFRSDQRNYEETVVDFVYTSAKIEGNTYDRLETDNLLRFGVTAGGKRYSDAVMLVNLREGFERVMAVVAGDELDLDYLCDLHKVVMKDLLPAHEQGIVRTSDVQITASRYTPLSDASRLRTEVKFVLSEANRFDNPFEKAIYLHCNLAYLQYFRDGNKRTARLMQTAALVRSEILPLFFRDSLIDRYQKATLHYYETGDYALYVNFFKENYELAVYSLAGRPDEKHYYTSASEAQEFSRRIDALSGLQSSTGASAVFWGLAHEAISAAGSARAVNWADIERRTIVKAITEHGFSGEDVRQVLVQHSPGMVSLTRQQDVADDIIRLEPVLRAGEK